MNIRGEKYEARSESEAVKWIEEQTGKKMRRCVIPTRQYLCYWISRDGILYGCRYFPRKRKYISYKCTKREKMHADGLIYNIQTPDGETNKLAARLIWCTWVLGYWSDKIKVRYKDGNRNNIDLSNLAELNDEWKIRTEHAGSMRKYEDIYRREFKQLVHDVRYKMGILEDEAKDVVQDAYIAVTRSHDGKAEYFGANWKVMAQKIALQYIERREFFVPMDIELTERIIGKPDNYNIQTILAPVKDKKDRAVLRLVAQGETLSEISAETGMSRTSVHRSLSRARRACRQYLSTDKEIMRIYGKKTRNQIRQKELPQAQ